MSDDHVYLLDTNILSNLEKMRPDPGLLDWIRRTEADRLVIPLSVVFEIQLGVEMVRRCDPERAREKENWLLGLLARNDMRVVIPGVEIIRLRARMYAEPSLRNFHLAHPGANKLKTGEDLLIAASAITEHAVIVTFNVADFVKIDQAFALPGLYDPGADVWPIAARSKLTIRNDRSDRSPPGPTKRPPKPRRSDPNWSRVAVPS